MKTTAMLRIPMLLFVILLYVSSIRGDSFGDVPSFKDLRDCAKTCITGQWSNGGIMNSRQCSTFKCICASNELALGLYYLADCIAKDKNSGGCDDNVQQQQALAEAVVREGCRKEGYNIDNVPSGGTGPTKTAEGHPTTGTGLGYVPIPTVTVHTATSVASVFFGDVLLLGIFAVSSVVIPALVFL
jgi:hypothetical protein